MKSTDEDRIAARLAKLMAMICVRNTGIEELHAGTVPVTHTGDYSDVFITDADGCVSKAVEIFRQRSPSVLIWA